MTTLTMRYTRGDFVVIGPLKFKSRREAKDWCIAHYPGSPLKEIGADAAKRSVKGNSPKPGRSK
jgi:hypothetical protein